MIGQQQLVLDWRTWLKGMSSSSEIDDGGFSPETEGVNLTAKPGAIYAPAALVDSDTDTRLTGELVASCPDHNVSSISQRLLAADDDKYYLYNGTKISNVAYTGGTASTVTKFYSDMIQFAGRTYITCKERIKEWSGASTIADLASFTNTTYPHPAIVFENNAFYGDGNVLLKQTTAGGTPTAVLTLSSDQIIIALGIDQGTGKLLISTINNINFSFILPIIARLHWYNGSSGTTDKTVIVEDAITAFHSFSGETIIGYKDKIGRINGSGIEFLRQLKNVFLDSDYLPTKHNFVNIGNHMYVLDGVEILAYGEVIKGAGKIWYYCGKNKVNSNKIRALFPVGLGKLGLSMDTSKFYTLAVSAISGSVADTAPTTLDKWYFMTNNIDFPRPIYPKSLQLEFINSFVYTSANFPIVYYDNSSPSGVSSVGSLRRRAGKTGVTVDDIIGFVSGQKVTSVKFLFENSTVQNGLKRIILFYDYAE